MATKEKKTPAHAGGVAFIARDLRDVAPELKNNQRKSNDGEI